MEELLELDRMLLHKLSATKGGLRLGPIEGK